MYSTRPTSNSVFSSSPIFLYSQLTASQRKQVRYTFIVLGTAFIAAASTLSRSAKQITEIVKTSGTPSSIYGRVVVLVGKSSIIASIVYLVVGLVVGVKIGASIGYKLGKKAASNEDEKSTAQPTQYLSMNIPRSRADDLFGADSSEVDPSSATRATHPWFDDEGSGEEDSKTSNDDFSIRKHRSRYIEILDKQNNAQNPFSKGSSSSSSSATAAAQQPNIEGLSQGPTSDEG